MTMMISKFHKLIQSRLLWGVFLVVIVFSFVIWGMIWPSDLDEAERANAAGLLAGEPVPHGEFRSAYLSTSMARALNMGRDVEYTPESEALLRRLSWQRLATLREARKLGITATEEELIGAIRANFAETNGVYNRQRYQAFLQNMLQPMGFTAGQFEQHVREEITIQKLASLIGRQAHVTPLEIRQTFDTLLDEFTAEYATVRPADVEAEVEATEADARQLFEANPTAFTLPEQREVSYAAFPVADYVDESMEIAEDEILDYYELHIEEYTTQETDTNGQPREVVADMDEVQDEIVKALRRAAAIEKADAAATELAFRAIPDRDGTVPEFAAEAEKSRRPAHKPAPFSRFDTPVADAGAAFTATAFELELDAFDRVSAPVRGQDNLYVIYLERVIPERVPAFEEIQDRAMTAARQNAVGEKMAAKAAAVKAAAEAGLAAGQTFGETVTALGLASAFAPPCTGLSGSSSTNPVVAALVQAVVSYNQGEVLEPVPFAEGMIVAHLQQRTPADPASFDSYRTEIAEAIRNRRAQGLFRDWQAALLDPALFTDLQRPAESYDDQEEGADEEVDLEEESAGTDGDQSPANTTDQETPDLETAPAETM